MRRPVVVVEDDARIAALVVRNLELAGFGCRAFGDAESALRELPALQPRLVVLDLNLPGMDGIEFTRRLRSDSRVPVLMLTARGTDTDKVLGFEIGADDYLTKPFSTRELVARVRALLRRADVDVDQEILVRGTLHIDASRRQATRDHVVLELTSLEFDLLYFLASHPGRVYSRDALMEHVWGRDRLVDARSIDSLVRRLRRKLEPKPSQPRYILTVWGAGYRFVDSS